MNVLKDLDQNSQHYLEQLLNKFRDSHQSVSCHLEGLYRSTYQNYWDYLRLDTLLSTQNPRTAYPDEMVFILYHQVAELYFRMVLWEMEQITATAEPVPNDIFLEKCDRICRYFRQLVSSMEIMTEGLDIRQFLEFRTSLTPASGFQSVQYRMIELNATGLECLTFGNNRGSEDVAGTLEEKYSRIYWKNGAKSRATGRKDHSLIDFEACYDKELLSLAREKADCNLHTLYNAHYKASEKGEEIGKSMQEMDRLINIEWPLMHYRAAARHLAGGSTGTGGTNWREYLPPRKQHIVFFPELHSDDVLDNWGLHSDL